MMQPQRSFWQFAVSFYDVAGAQPLLLRWQDEQGLDVSLLLWALWLDLQGKPHDGPFWQQGVTGSAAGRQRVVCWRRWRRRCPRWLAPLRRWLLHRELQQERRVIEGFQRLTPGAEIRVGAGEWPSLGFCESLLRELGLEAQQSQLNELLKSWLADQG